jgi:IclR family acetate operon transcriptional repressor
MTTELVDAVLRAMKVLEQLSMSEMPQSARDLAAEINVPKSTVQRLLQTLEHCEAVTQDAQTQRYRLGPFAMQLGMASLRGMDLRGVALPLMRELRDETGETVGLNIRVRDTRMYIEQVESPHLLLAKAEVGRPYPLHTGSPGQVLLAFEPEDEISRLLSEADYSALTRKTLKSRTAVEKRLEQVRERGYAEAFEETIAGLNTIAAPIYGALGQVTAALSVSGPVSRFGEKEMNRVLPRLLATAQTISKRLGYRGAGNNPPAAGPHLRKTTA